MAAAACWLLGGCSALSAMNPVNWWHRQEGGKIAEQRPAPPGADQPYPNISTVPEKPAAPDAAALKKLTDLLVADRTNAQHAAQAAPLADPSSPRSSPTLFGVGTAPPPPPPSGAAPSTSGAPGTPVASASIPAVSAPPPPAGSGASGSGASGAAPAPSAAPRRSVQSAALDTLPQGGAAGDLGTRGAASDVSAPAAGPAAAAPAAAPASQSAAVDAGALPTGTPPALPAGPPPRPGGVVAPPVATAAASSPMPAPVSGRSATIVFLAGASDLSAPATDEVKAFAASRGNGAVSVTGYGEAASSDPQAQSAALNLGLARAQSIVEALKAAGVPGNAIRVSAEASGRGALLHLLQ